MIDIKLIRENKNLVKENIKKKFQDEKLVLVDEVYELDKLYRETKTEADELRNEKNKKSAMIGSLMREGKTEEAGNLKKEISDYGDKILQLEEKEEKLNTEIHQKMMVI